MLRKLLLAFLLLLPLSSSASLTQESVTSFTGFNFSVSGASVAGYSSACNTLLLDLNGAIFGSGRFTTYGAFNCPAINGGYPIVGVGYP